MTTRNLLLGILIVIVFGIGLLVGRFGSDEAIYVENKKPSSMQTANQTGTGTVANTTTSTTQEAPPSIISGMSNDQRKMLNALGIDINKITPTMIACAETSLGTSRTTEIKGGASLSFTEKAKLLACYK